MVGHFVVWDKEDIAVHEQIGVGQFGETCRATLLVSHTTAPKEAQTYRQKVFADRSCGGRVIAVKTAKASPNDTTAFPAAASDFLNEALITARFRHRVQPNKINK